MSKRLPCSLHDCDKPRYSHGLCRSHQYRLLKYGNPLAGGTALREAREHFENKVSAHEGDNCLAWPFAHNNWSRAVLWYDGKLCIVGRLICERTHGPAPTTSHEAAHSCGKEWCVNRWHLEWKTHVANEADKLAHGTHLRGERGPSKLTEEQVREIISLRGILSQSKLAARFGVSQPTVSEIQNGKKWRHIDVAA